MTRVLLLSLVTEFSKEQNIIIDLSSCLTNSLKTDPARDKVSSSSQPTNSSDLYSSKVRTMSIILDGAVSVILDSLLDDLTSITRQLQNAEIAKEIKKWRPILKVLRSVLEDTENKISSNSEIESWVDDLEDIALDVEDMLGELQNKVMQDQKRWYSGLFSSCFNSQRNISQSQSMTVVELKKLTDRLTFVAETKHLLYLTY